MNNFSLATVQIDGNEKLVIRIEGNIYALDELARAASKESIPLTLDKMLHSWGEIREHLSEIAQTPPSGCTPLDMASLTFCSPVLHPTNLICIGTNYQDHLDEMKMATKPEYPYGFLRPRGCLAAHGETIPLPKGPEFIDWEAELGIVVGKKVVAGQIDEAKDAIAGYTIINDVSARDWIVDRPAVGIDWVMQKAWDKFQPTGPWFVPREQIEDVQNLDIRLSVNGQVKQDSNTGQMIFGVSEIMTHLAGIMTLEPGDIIATGTPAGVGFGQDPQQRIQSGDVVAVEIEGLGVLENRFV